MNGSSHNKLRHIKLCSRSKYFFKLPTVRWSAQSRYHRRYKCRVVICSKMGRTRISNVESDKIRLYCRMNCSTNPRAGHRIFSPKIWAYPDTVNFESNRIRLEGHSTTSNQMSLPRRSSSKLHTVASSKMRRLTKELRREIASIAYDPWPIFVHCKIPVIRDCVIACKIPARDYHSKRHAMVARRRWPQQVERCLSPYIEPARLNQQPIVLQQSQYSVSEIQNIKNFKS